MLIDYKKIEELYNSAKENKSAKCASEEVQSGDNFISVAITQDSFFDISKKEDLFIVTIVKSWDAPVVVKYYKDENISTENVFDSTISEAVPEVERVIKENQPKKLQSFMSAKMEEAGLDESMLVVDLHKLIKLGVRNIKP
jgi:hypothetical protein